MRVSESLGRQVAQKKESVPLKRRCRVLPLTEIASEADPTKNSPDSTHGLSGLLFLPPLPSLTPFAGWVSDFHWVRAAANPR